MEDNGTDKQSKSERNDIVRFFTDWKHVLTLFEEEGFLTAKRAALRLVQRVGRYRRNPELRERFLQILQRSFHCFDVRAIAEEERENQSRLRKLRESYKRRFRRPQH